MDPRGSGSVPIFHGSATLRPGVPLLEHKRLPWSVSLSPWERCACRTRWGSPGGRDRGSLSASSPCIPPQGLSQQSIPVSSVVDPHCFHCGSGSSIFLTMRIWIRTQIQIRGFDDRKLKKKNYRYSWKFFYIFFWSKIAIYLSLSLQATGKVFIPQKRTFVTSKLEFSSLLWFILALLDAEPYFQCWSGSRSSRSKLMRIRIHNTAGK